MSNLNRIGMMNKAGLTVTIIILAFVFSSSAFCETINSKKEPSKNETLDYIIEKMHACNTYDGDPLSVKLNANVLTLEFNGKMGEVKHLIPLANIRDVSTSGAFDKSTTDIVFRFDRDVVVSTNPTIYDNTLNCMNMEPEIAHRLVRAFNHLKEISEPDTSK